MGRGWEYHDWICVCWRVPNPPGANPVAAERAFPTVTIGVAQGLPGVQKK